MIRKRRLVRFRHGGDRQAFVLQEPLGKTVPGIDESATEGEAHRGADGNAIVKWHDGFVGRVPTAGHGGAAWAVHRAVPDGLLHSRQEEWSGGLFLQAAAGSGKGDIR